MAHPGDVIARNLRMLAASLAVTLSAALGTAADTGRVTTGATNALAWDGQKRVVKPEDEWRRQLTPEQFRVLRRKGTERAFTGRLWDNHDRGVYRCAGCDLPLFDSETKFDSGTGWPSFWQPIAPANVGTEPDNSLFMKRTEVHCARCGGHLGHVFEDGPKPTGLRYCINSVSLTFTPAKSGATNATPAKPSAQR